MRRVTEKEMDAVLRLDGPSRFKRFVKVVADTGEAWGLWNDGWALYEDDAKSRVFPLWPARDYAEACREGEWLGYEATAMSLDELLNELLPKLRQQQVLAGIFPTPHGRGTTPSLDELEDAIREELQAYE